MIWIVTCLDKKDALQRRLDIIEAHRAYLKTAPIKMLLSGPLVADDGETMKGSFFMVEAESRDEVLTFNEADPLKHADVWETVIIEAFFKRVDNLSGAGATA